MTIEEAATLPPEVILELYTTLDQCASWFAGQPFTIQDWGINPWRAINRADLCVGRGYPEDDDEGDE